NRGGGVAEFCEGADEVHDGIRIRQRVVDLDAVGPGEVGCRLTGADARAEIQVARERVDRGEVHGREVVRGRRAVDREVTRAGDRDPDGRRGSAVLGGNGHTGG